MFKKILTIAIAGLMIQALCVQPATAASKAERQARRAEEVREGILRLGVGADARVTLKLRDKEKLAGYVSEAKHAYFVVTDVKTNTATTVAYTEVAQVKGHNLGTGAKVSIGIGIGVGLTVLILFAIVFRRD